MPTRSRPQAALEAHNSFVSTAGSEVDVVWVLDGDDSAIDGYLEAVDTVKSRYYITVGNMVERTNKAVKILADTYDVLGWSADDNRCRTTRWDSILAGYVSKGAKEVQAWDGNGPRASSPNSGSSAATFMTSGMIKALGWMALPGSEHLYIDNAFDTLRSRLGESAVFANDIIIEHMHPALDKGIWDDQYTGIHRSENYAHDQAAYQKWVEEDLDNDVRKVLEYVH